MKNFGMNGVDNGTTGSGAPSGRNRGSGRSGKAPRKWVRFQPLLHIPIGPWICAALIEKGCADDAHVPAISIFLIGVGFADRAETECRHGIGALTETFHDELAMGLNNVTALTERSGAPIEHIQSVNGKNHLQAKSASVAHHNRVAAAFFSHDKPTLTDYEPR